MARRYSKYNPPATAMLRERIKPKEYTRTVIAGCRLCIVDTVDTSSNSFSSLSSLFGSRYHELFGLDVSEACWLRPKDITMHNLIGNKVTFVESMHKRLSLRSRYYIQTTTRLPVFKSIDMAAQV